MLSFSAASTLMQPEVTLLPDRAWGMVGKQWLFSLREIVLMFPNNKAVLWQEKKIDKNKAVYVEGGVGF